MKNLTPQEQTKAVLLTKLEIIKDKQSEIEKLLKSLQNRQKNYVELAAIMKKGTKVIVKPKFMAQFYGIVDGIYFDFESEFDFVRYMIKPVKKGWRLPKGFNRRHSVGIVRKNELLHVEDK